MSRTTASQSWATAPCVWCGAQLDFIPGTGWVHADTGKTYVTFLGRGWLRSDRRASRRRRTIVKPKEQKPAIVYRIIDRTTGEVMGSYSRAYCEEYDFESPAQARNSNVLFQDRARYAIAQYRVTYELLAEDVP